MTVLHAGKMLAKLYTSQVEFKLLKVRHKFAFHFTHTHNLCEIISFTTATANYAFSSDQQAHKRLKYSLMN